MAQPDLMSLARELAAALNDYENHVLRAIPDPARGIQVAAHTDVRECADRSLHDPWSDVVRRWPHYDPRAAGLSGVMSGAEIAVLSDGDVHAMVRYVATDHRWVVDEAWSSARTA